MYGLFQLWIRIMLNKLIVSFVTGYGQTVLGNADLPQRREPAVPQFPIRLQRTLQGQGTKATKPVRTPTVSVCRFLEAYSNFI